MNTRPLTELQSAAFQVIKNHVGKRQAITGADIQKQINLTDKDHKKGANMRSIINTLRDKGYAICACEDGYYYAENPQELKEYIDEFQNRIDQQQASCNALKEKYNTLASIYTPGASMYKL